MLKIYKNFRLFIVIAIILSMLTVYGAFNPANAASLKDISDTLSDSGPSAVATHTIEFTTNVELAANEYVEVTLPTEFGDIATGTCPWGILATTTETFRCTADDTVATNTPYIITIDDVTNPSASSTYHIYIKTHQSGGAVIEQGDMMVAIVDGVSVTATVPSTLTFEITGLDADTNVNGATTNATSTANSIPFGALDYNATTTIGQQLSVTTNASGGFTVTVQQNRNLTSDNGSDIDAFIEGDAASTTAVAWADPVANLNDENTYGHFGLTSEDSSLDGGAFGAGNYKGFPNALTTDPVYPIEVMYHNGPADGSGPDVGSTQVAYSIKITSLQEAGDYTNTLTYICTPTY